MKNKMFGLKYKMVGYKSIKKGGNSSEMPVELVLNVLEQIEPKDRARLCNVNKRYQAICKRYNLYPERVILVTIIGKQYFKIVREKNMKDAKKTVKKAKDDEQYAQIHEEWVINNDKKKYLVYSWVSTRKDWDEEPQELYGFYDNKKEAIEIALKEANKAYKEMDLDVRHINIQDAWGGEVIIQWGNTFAGLMFGVYEVPSFNSL